VTDQPADRIHLFDANAIIEAVRTGVWNALTGGLTIETVRECADECRQGDTLSTGYVAVSEEELGRLAAIRDVSDTQRAAVLLNDASAGLDPGERDLFAHALSLPAESPWVICSPDRASVKFAVAAGCEDRLISLDETVGAVGARAAPPLRSHFTSRWLSVERTKARLGIR
jgi:hypothetical protein